MLAGRRSISVAVLFVAACSSDLDEFRVGNPAGGDAGGDAGGASCGGSSAVLACGATCADLLDSVYIEDGFDDAAALADVWRVNFEVPRVADGALWIGPHTDDTLTSLLSWAAVGDGVLCSEFTMPIPSTDALRNSVGFGFRDFASGVQLNFVASTGEVTLIGIGETSNVVLDAQNLALPASEGHFAALLARTGSRYVGEILEKDSQSIAQLSGTHDSSAETSVGVEASELDVQVSVDLVMVGRGTDAVLAQIE